jgi:streptogramin lyase
MRQAKSLTLSIAALLGVACTPQQSIDASAVVDAYTSVVDAYTPVDAGIDAHEVPDAGIDALGDGGFRTARVCPMWRGLPSGGVTLGGTNTSPEGLRVGPDCALYVASNDTVFRIAEGSGEVTSFASNPAMAADLQGIEFGPDGALYVAARTQNVIVRFNGTTGAFIDIFTSTGLDGPNTPRFGPDGRLYVSCRNTTTVVRIEPTGGAATLFATHPQLGSPEGISFGPDGNLYVAARTNSFVARFDGVTGAFLDQITATPAFMAPEGIAFDPDGSLWIANRDTSEVLRFDASTRVQLERLATPPTEQPIGLEVVNGQLVVGMRGTGRITVLP